MPFTNITNLAAPTITWVYDPVEGRGPLHICDTVGKNRYRSRVKITRCGKGIANYSTNSFDGNLTDLCAGCGTLTDFEKAIEDSRKYWAARNEREKADAEKVRAEHERLHQERCERIHAIALTLIAAGMRVGCNGVKATVEFRGHKFEIKEAE